MKSLEKLTLGLTLLFASTVIQANLAHDYELNNSYTDQLGGPSLVPLGGTLNATRYSFGANQGLSLTGGFAEYGNFSLEMKFNFASLDGWQKIVDFKNLSLDEGLYDYNKKLQFVVVSGSGFETAPNEGFAPNQDVNLVLTRNGNTNQVVAYLSGIEQFSFIDSTNQAVFSSVGNIANFFIDDQNTGGFESSAGSVDYLRIYDTPLTQTQAACLNTGTPTACGLTNLPEPNTLALIVFGIFGFNRFKFAGRQVTTVKKGI